MEGTLEIGQAAENAALDYLKTQGLKLIARNQRYRTGEIDLIMRDAGHLVFIEVRYRRNPNFGSAAESVTFRKQQRIIRAAQSFLLQHPAWRDTPCRFDVVALAPAANGWQYNWLRDAFCA